MHSSTSSLPMLGIGRAVAPRPRPRTPYLRLDVAVAVTRYRSLSALLGADVHYAVKANPHPDLLAALAGEGSCFDVASPQEIASALAAGAVPEQLLYSNPVKSRSDIASAYAAGVTLFVVDSLPEVRKVAAVAPGSAVLCRLLTSGDGSDWPLSPRVRLLRHRVRRDPPDGRRARSPTRGHQLPRGQSAAPAPTPGRRRSRRRAGLRRAARRRLRPWLLDLGGGFPADLEEGTLRSRRTAPPSSPPSRPPSGPDGRAS